MGTLSLSLLGHFRAERDGHPLAGIESVKGRALLAYLTVETQRPHGRSELAWLLWPDVPDSTALTNLRQTLANLRGALGDRTNPIPYLLIERDSIQFNTASDYQLDVVEFRLLLQACQQHRHRHPARCTSCAQRFARAASLYQGDFLAHSPSVDSEPFERWVEAEREPLQQQVLAALEQLVAYHEHRGQHEQALEYARLQAMLAPWHEEGHRKVMQLLVWLGRRSAALAHYHRMVELLDEELGVEPDAESRQLYEQLYQGEINGLETDNVPKHNLPTPSNRFIGREAVLGQLHALLEEPTNRLVTVVGPGGIGKTRLALQAAFEQRHAYQDGVYFVGLAPIRDPELVISAIMQVLGIKEVVGQPPLEGLKQYLHDKELLLLLDNFEQVVEAAPVVTELLATAPGLQILVTSREALNLSVEHLFPTPPLLLPDTARSSLDALTTNEALQLYVQRAQAVKPSFTLTEENALTVAKICAQVDGLPLAIELAASRIRTLSPLAILERLHHRLQLLTGGPRDLPARQQTLRATIDWSYQLLTAQEQRLFARLGVFVGGWTLEAAEAVCNPSHELGMDVLDGLGALVDKSLIQQWEAGGEPRYAMLESIQDFAREQLEQSGEAEKLEHCHTEFFLTFAEAVGSVLRGPEQAVHLSRLEREHENLRAVLARSQVAGVEKGLRLAGALGQFWMVRGYLVEGRQWLEGLLLDAATSSASVRAKVLLEIGKLALAQSDYNAAAKFFAQSLALYRSIGDVKGVAAALTMRGSVACEQGDYEGSACFHQESLKFQRQLGDKEGLTGTLLSLGTTAHRQGDYPLAEAWLEECLSLARELGNRGASAGSLHTLGLVAFQKGELVRATRLHVEALALFRSLGHKRGTALSLNCLAILALEEGDRPKGARFFRESLLLAYEMGDKEASAWSLEGLARVARERGEQLRAARLLATVGALREVIGAPHAAVHQAYFDRSVSEVRSQLDRGQFERVWTEGRMMTLEQAIGYALEDTGPIDKIPSHGTRETG